MSKFVQIEIRLVPIYGAGGLGKNFPKFAEFLKKHGYTKVLEDQPSLYHLVDVLVRICNDPAVSKEAKAAILRMENQFETVRDEAREHLLARRLNELDQSLYRLEDLYVDLETELEWG